MIDVCFGCMGGMGGGKLYYCIASIGYAVIVHYIGIPVV